MINNRLAWIIMEIPVLVLFVWLYLTGPVPKTPVLWVFFGLFVFHYVHRVFIFPLRIRTKGKRMPVSVMFMAIFFNLVNGSLNGYWFGHLSGHYDLSWLLDPRFIAGLVLFMTGMLINIHYDQMLIRLRNGNAGGYSIPYGGLFRFISCPNFFGEIIEWGGYAMLTWCLPTLSFFLWTVFNLVPRAKDHHRWYRDTFPEYPHKRKAIIPFIL